MSHSLEDQDPPQLLAVILWPDRILEAPDGALNSGARI